MTGPLENAANADGHVEGDREHRLAVGLVEARKGPAGVGGLELGGGDGVRGAVGVGERRAVEADQAVVEDAGEGDDDGDWAPARGVVARTARAARVPRRATGVSATAMARRDEILRPNR